MPEALVIGGLAVVFTVVASWIGRRVLDTRVGWVRAVVVSLVVYFAALPAVLWVLGAADVLADGRFLVDDVVAVAFLLLVAAWMLAVTLVVLVALEFLWPSHPGLSPLAALRAGRSRRQRARRYAQILSIASKHGIAELHGRAGTPDRDLPRAIAAAFDEAGVTFVKVGQVLSGRDDLLPPEFAHAFASLQMDSTPLPWPEAKAAIEAQLHRPLAEVFGEIDETPLAAASVGQVHTARLVSGEPVVIKVQRPAARAEVSVDLDIIRRLAHDLERRTTWGADIGAVALAEEFARALSEELDYRNEIENIGMLRAAVPDPDHGAVRIPNVYPELCTAQLIVMEQAEGIPFSRLPSPEHPLEVAQADSIADAVLDAIFTQIAVQGVFHADLHPGNLILGADGSVTLIDFGAVGIVEKSLRRLLVPLLIAMENEDDASTTDVILLLMTPTNPDVQVDTAALQHDIGVILTRMHNAHADEDTFRALIHTVRAHRLSIPPALLLIFRTLSSLESSLRHLDPHYDLVGRALTRAPHYALQLTNPRSAALTAEVQLQLMLERMRLFPRRADQILRGLEEGRIAIRLKTFESPSERSWIERLTGRFTTTVVGVALLITGILLGVTGDGPMLTDDVAAFPFLGSAVGLAGVLLLVRALRSALTTRP